MPPDFSAPRLRLGFLGFWGGIVGGVMDETGKFWTWLSEEPKDGR